jgi:hypothetical protein
VREGERREERGDGHTKKKTPPYKNQHTNDTLREYCYRHGARIASQDNCNSMYRKERERVREEMGTPKKKHHHTKPPYK